ncbi:hypothetical protein MPH_06566 [Macrophomina phaseolina MS6]|uniref:Uncharacterized protein n=2 Tax=Macrophomina phaseolina TaxID=35725 RepID=K2RNF7_MACPH|nr:hypothetical protein MPH_06566 [Macrophomina phaseolina MS6]
MATPFRHGISNRADVLEWAQLYRNIDTTGSPVNTEPLPELLPVTEVGAWCAAQGRKDRVHVEHHGCITRFRYLKARLVDRIEEPSWMAIYDGFAKDKEKLWNRGIPYVSPGQPPAWMPITELGAWIAACTDEQREAVLRRAQMVKEAYERTSERSLAA